MKHYCNSILQGLDLHQSLGAKQYFQMLHHWETFSPVAETLSFSNSVNKGGQIVLEWEQVNERLSEKCTSCVSSTHCRIVMQGINMS